MTIRQEIEAEIAALEAKKAELVESLANMGPLAEHELESLKSWIQAIAKRIGL